MLDFPAISIKKTFINNHTIVSNHTNNNNKFAIHPASLHSSSTILNFHMLSNKCSLYKRGKLRVRGYNVNILRLFNQEVKFLNYRVEWFYT